MNDPFEDMSTEDRAALYDKMIESNLMNPATFMSRKERRARKIRQPLTQMQLEARAAAERQEQAEDD